jgi:2-amino-4-hydroxy-6-hydroxymethyldihydropteridine diphosphokinase
MRVFIGLGSNVGDRVGNIKKAIRLLSEVVTLVQSASWYETEPVGVEGPWFINTVVEVKTDLTPQELLRVCKDIEFSLGRKGDKNKREIDLDILLWGDLILSEKELEIPHPRLCERGFVLVPLAEIAPEVIHPRLKVTVQKLLEGLNKREKVMRYRKERDFNKHTFSSEKGCHLRGKAPDGDLL